MGDRGYEETVDKYANTVYRVAYSYCKSKCDAEDVLQNTFLKLLQTATYFTDEAHMRRWLIRVAINESKNLCTSFWRRKMDSLEMMDAEPVFHIKEESELYESVKQLPKKYRIVVHLFYYEGYSTSEIAEILNSKEATVRTQLARARERLKQQLKEAWYDE